MVFTLGQVPWEVGSEAISTREHQGGPWDLGSAPESCKGSKQRVKHTVRTGLGSPTECSKTIRALQHCHTLAEGCAFWPKPNLQTCLRTGGCHLADTDVFSLKQKIRATQYSSYSGSHSFLTSPPVVPESFLVLFSAGYSSAPL